MDYTFGTFEGPCSDKPKEANHGVLGKVINVHLSNKFILNFMLKHNLNR
jgi:hypothetical protein